MALPFRKGATTPPAAPSQPVKAVVASAVNVSERGSKAFYARKSDDYWQKAAWYQFDICGELRYATTWIANAISMASMYPAEVDPDTGLVTEATENATVQRIAGGILGGAAMRSQFQSTIALNWQIAGEVFILIRPRPNGMGDEWLVLSTTEIHERGGQFTYEDPMTGEMMNMVSDQDMLIRIWSPHPRKRSHADSAVRAALPTLREIEKTSQNIAARLDSRLASNGMLFLPQEVDFPSRNDGEPGLVGFMDEVIEATRIGIAEPGQASAQVPIMMQIPGEQVGNVQHIDLSTELSNEVLELRTAAIRRLALSLDMPAEIMLGMGDTNHWSAWQVEESAYKIHVAPILDRLGDALTTIYLRPALVAAGIRDPERYILAFDTTEIISRPNRFDELNQLHDKILISDDYLRSQNGIPDDAVPDDEERSRRLFTQLVVSAPTLVTDVPEIASALGIEPAEVAEDAVGVEALPTSNETEARALPEGNQDSPDDGVAASGAPLHHLTAAAELIVYDALSRAGGRLLTRSYRGQFYSTAKHELHTVIPFGEADIPRLTEGSFQFTHKVADGFGIDKNRFHTAVDAYVHRLLVEHSTHNTAKLREVLCQIL